MTLELLATLLDARIGVGVAVAINRQCDDAQINSQTIGYSYRFGLLDENRLQKVETAVLQYQVGFALETRQSFARTIDRRDNQPAAGALDTDALLCVGEQPGIVDEGGV